MLYYILIISNKMKDQIKPNELVIESDHDCESRG